MGQLMLASTVFYGVMLAWLGVLVVVWLLCVAAKRADREAEVAAAHLAVTRAHASYRQPHP